MIAPGIYPDMANDAYHADADYLSSTRLKGYLPEHYKKAPPSSDALAFGTLFHTCVLEPDRLTQYVVLDAAKIAGDNPKTGRPYDAPQMTAKFKAAAVEAEADGRTVVTQEAWDRAHRMRDAIHRHDTARRLLFEEDGRAELSAFAVDAAGVAHKARFDRVITAVGIDLKSTSGKPGPDAIARAVIDYGYDLSAAHYLAVADLLDLDVQAFAFVFCTKPTTPDEEPMVTVCDLDEPFLARGRALRERAIRRHTDPAEPRYQGATGFLTITAPQWALRKEPA